MIQYLVYFFLLMINFLFNQFKHPLMLGLTLLIQTFLMCLMIGIISKSFWFSYILFLIFIGGMLILFIYVISLISNNKFNFLKIKVNKMMIMMMLIFFFSITIYILDYKFYLQSNDLMKFSDMKSELYENSMNLNKLYNFPTNLINLLLVNYLFLLLIITVKITKIFHGPLRMKN